MQKFAAISQSTPFPRYTSKGIPVADFEVGRFMVACHSAQNTNLHFCKIIPKLDNIEVAFC